MNISVNEHRFPSSSGLTDIYALSYTPADEGEVKGIVQICHGMAEHCKRYDEFARFLCKNGYAVFINDHLGHGNSVARDEELGFFGESSGVGDLVNDAKILSDLARSLHPDKPFFIFGHSMGSFIARKYTEKFGMNIDGAVFCGTSGTNPAAGIAVKIADFIGSKKGYTHRSEFINKIAFGGYNKRVEEKRTDFDWLTRDESAVDRYIEDPKCGFLFTCAGYRDLFTLLKSVSQRSWYENVPFILPILLIAGAEDPVGEYGKGVKQVFRDLKKTGHKDVSLKLYENDRHEILNELNRHQVYDDVLSWLSEAAEKKAD